MPLKDGSIIRLEVDLPDNLINVLNKFMTSDVVNIN
jgi:hypothetical protein